MIGSRQPTRRSPVAGGERTATRRLVVYGFGRAARAFGLIAIAVTMPGLTLRSHFLVFLGSGFVALALAMSDIARIDRRGVTPMTAYSLSAAAIGFANAVGVASEGTARRGQYYLYVAEEHLFLASLLALAGTVLPVLAFWSIQRNRQARALASVLPAVGGYVNARMLVPGVIGAVLLMQLLRLVVDVYALGALGALVALTPHLAVFVLARAGAERKLRGALPLALLIAIVEATRAVLFSYLRADAVAPVAAFVFGTLLGSRSLAPLRSKYFIPVYAAMVAFTVYFGAFGAVRAGGPKGLERLAEVQRYQQSIGESQERQSQTVLSRLTTFNQLSQVGRVVEEDGFLGGSTLEYLAYAFIPRFIWKDKPIIAKGAWFALRIGQARTLPGGIITNSVNMTIPGELYLNFGWPGVWLGGLVFGAILGVLWVRTRFWTTSLDALGTAFGFYFFWVWVGFSLGADLQILVTLIAYYLVFMALTAILGRASGGRMDAKLRMHEMPRQMRSASLDAP